MGHYVYFPINQKQSNTSKIDKQILELVNKIKRYDLMTFYYQMMQLVNQKTKIENNFIEMNNRSI